MGVLSDIEWDCLGDNKGRKKRATESEDKNKKTNEHNKRMEYTEM